MDPYKSSSNIPTPPEAGSSSNENAKKIQPVFKFQDDEEELTRRLMAFKLADTPLPPPPSSSSSGRSSSLIRPAKLSLPDLNRAGSSGVYFSGSENSSLQSSEGLPSSSKRIAISQCHLGPGIAPPNLFGKWRNPEAPSPLEDGSLKGAANFSLEKSNLTPGQAENKESQIFSDSEDSTFNSTKYYTAVGSELELDQLDVTLVSEDKAEAVEEVVTLDGAAADDDGETGSDRERLELKIELEAYVNLVRRKLKETDLLGKEGSDESVRLMKIPSSSANDLVAWRFILSDDLEKLFDSRFPAEVIVRLSVLSDWPLHGLLCHTMGIFEGLKADTLYRKFLNQWQGNDDNFNKVIFVALTDPEKVKFCGMQNIFNEYKKETNPKHTVKKFLTAPQLKA